MGTGRTFNKKPRSRPKKKASERRRRDKTQRKRLTALGVDEAKVGKMDAKRVRTLLSRPKVTERKAAAGG